MGRSRAGARKLAVALATLAISVTASTALAQSPGVEGQARVESYLPPPGALIAPGSDPTLTLLHTGYVIGYIEPCG